MARQGTERVRERKMDRWTSDVAASEILAALACSRDLWERQTDGRIAAANVQESPARIGKRDSPSRGDQTDADRVSF